VNTGDEAAALDGAVAELDAVEAALSRLDDGTLDRCEICGAPVGPDRLLQNPLLARCEEHSPAQPS
jgi:RNA polymerase-binding transcription factor DksA